MVCKVPNDFFPCTILVDGDESSVNTQDMVEMAVHHALGEFDNCVDVFVSNGSLRADSRFDDDRVRAFLTDYEPDEDYND